VIHSFRAEGAFKVTTAIGFTGFILALILLNSILVSLSEPARVFVMGVGLLLAGRVCASKHKRPGARMSTVTHVTSLVCLILLASVLSTSCAKKPEVAKRAYLESGDGYFAQKKYHEAIVQYRNAVQKDPRFGEARYKLAEAYVRINDPAGAYREYIRAADLMPTNVESQLKAGQIEGTWTQGSQSFPLIFKRLLEVEANYYVVTEWKKEDSGKMRRVIQSKRRHWKGRMNGVATAKPNPGRPYASNEPKSN
jgi:hypothetical protein